MKQFRKNGLTETYEAMENKKQRSLREFMMSALTTDDWEYSIHKN